MEDDCDGPWWQGVTVVDPVVGDRDSGGQWQWQTVYIVHMAQH